MSRLIELPHAVHESTCYVNGLFDLLTWHGAKYDYYLLCMIGGMASFAYLKFKMSVPPCMVYWGNNTRYLLKQLEDIIGFKQTISEGNSFNNEFPRIKQYLDASRLAIVGALDMYYLHYYPDIYQKEHIPIHYVLVVGYDDEQQKVFVHDCSVEAYSKNLSGVPGLSERKCPGHE